jgi:hypothetical protein
MVSPANPDQKMQHCPHRKTIAEMAEAVQQWWLSAKAERVAERLVAVPSQVEYVLQSSQCEKRAIRSRLPEEERVSPRQTE